MKLPHVNTPTLDGMKQGDVVLFDRATVSEDRKARVMATRLQPKRFRIVVMILLHPNRPEQAMKVMTVERLGDRP